jgi:hypothetical protein
LALAAASAIAATDSGVGAAFADRPADSPGARELPGLVPILPIIQSLWPEQMAGDWLRALRNDILAMREIQHAPLGRIQRLADRSGEALFDSIIVFETCSADETLRHRSGVMPGLNAPESFETTIYAIGARCRNRSRTSNRLKNTPSTKNDCDRTLKLFVYPQMGFMALILTAYG